jgi:serine/threonine protein phosphatase PrpC
MTGKKNMLEETKRTNKNSYQPSFIFSRYTIPHIDHPQRNEDSLFVDRHRGLAIVCDGIGGAQAGEVASQLAVQSIQQGWRQVIKQHATKAGLLLAEGLNVPEILTQLVEGAQAAITEEGKRRAEQAERERKEVSYPGTTLAMGVLCRLENGRYQLVHAHVGDSRIYFLRAEEAMRRLTQDDNYLATKVAEGSITEEEAWYIDQAMRGEQLDEVERSYFNKRNGITQALSHPDPYLPEYLDIHVGETTLAAGDRILLCSDGIHDNLTDFEIEETLRNAPASLVALRLVHQAGVRSRENSSSIIRAKADDMSAIVVNCYA